MSEHSELEHEETMIGRALDALDDIVAIDGGDPVLDPDLRDYYEVLGYMPIEDIAPPVALESRVLAAARAARAPAVPSLSSRRRKKARVVTLGAAAAVAAAVALAVVVDNGGPGTYTQGRNVAKVDPAKVEQYRSTSGAHSIELTGPGGTAGNVVVTPQGHGALYNTNLHAEPGITYWFWVSSSEGSIPVASVSTKPGSGLTFSVNGATPTGAFITAETGLSRPTTPGATVASGTFG
jgi:hypothetical protein